MGEVCKIEITAELIDAAASVLEGILWEDTEEGGGTSASERRWVAEQVLKAGLAAVVDVIMIKSR